LIRVAASCGATSVALTGSVARGEDKDGSDLDFFVYDFADPESPDAGKRANRLVKEFRRILAPYRVDVRPLPGWPLGPEFEQKMRADAILLPLTNPVTE
jgi:predicted nucleotidyltransferase